MARPARRARGQAQGLGLLVGAALSACAKPEPPPGGPPDTAAPAVLSVQPESGAVVPRWNDPAVIRFNEVIDEMAAGGSGAAIAGLAGQVILSPVAGDVAVSWHRTAIRVRPREGWKTGRVYHLQLLPGIIDLRRNRLDTGRTVIFSTGPAIPSAALSGTALHWTEQRALQRGLIQAIRRPDTVGYLTVTDSSGNFRVSGIPPGDYVVYVVQDQNTNRRRDAREAYDSARTPVDSSATVLLWAFVHDTAGPRLRTAEPVDSVTFRLQFTQHLDPTARLDTASVRLFALPDTTPVRLAGVLTPAVYDSLRARERAERASADSARRAATDTARRAPPAAQRAPPPAAPGAAPGRPADTTRVRRLLSQRPVPIDRLVIRSAEPLKPDARYLVRVVGARNLDGIVGGGQLVLATPKPTPVPQDTTRAP